MMLTLRYGLMGAVGACVYERPHAALNGVAARGPGEAPRMLGNACASEAAAPAAAQLSLFRGCPSVLGLKVIPP